MIVVISKSVLCWCAVVKMTAFIYSCSLSLHQKREMGNIRKEMALLCEVRCHWDGMAAFRQERDRCKRYCYGDQWGDLIKVDGTWMREEHYIRMHGSEPLKNNLIRRLVKQVLGLFRSEHDLPQPQCQRKREADCMVEILSDIDKLNCVDELNVRALEEFLISGMVAQRKTFGWRQGHCDCWTDNVALDYFFIDNAMIDCRGWDVGCVGEIHDLSFDKLCCEFAHSESDVQWLQSIYGNGQYEDRVRQMLSDFGMDTGGPTDFFFPGKRHFCRVYEVWRKELHWGWLCHDRTQGRLFWSEEAPPRDVSGKWTPKEEWHFYYLTPFGDVLAEGLTPYSHQGHPYVFKAYPFIDGEVHSFVSDIIDQQRYTNRLITLYDWVMRSSAKGVLLVPEESIPDGYTLSDVADEWSRFNGVIPVRTRNGESLPQQVSANAVNVGINELLQTQLGFMEDISGVTGALQGKASNAGVSGTLYEQQTHNSALSQLDLLDSFRHFLTEGRRKDMSNVQQFYSDERLAERMPASHVMAFRQAKILI